MIPHYFQPSHMTKTSHTRPCCAGLEADHQPAVNGTQVRIQMKRDLRLLGGRIIAKGTVLDAELRVDQHGMQEVSPSRWGTNILGQFAELERAVYVDVQTVAYAVKPAGMDWWTQIPTSWAKEV